jgi:hypothetical protein
MARTAYLRLLVVLGLALVGLIVALVVLEVDGDAVDLPPPLRSVFPQPSDVVVRQTAVEVELPIGYEITLTVDGVRIPSDEIAAIPEIGLFRWQPGPGRVVDRWAPGDVTVEVSWDRLEGLRPDPGTYTWTFRVA